MVATKNRKEGTGASVRDEAPTRVQPQKKESRRRVDIDAIKLLQFN